MSLAAAAPALLIGGSAVGAATSAMGARSQNRALQKQVNASAKSAGIQIAQLGQRAAIERENRQNEVANLLGSVRAAASERGSDQTSTLIESDITQQAGRQQDLLEIALGNDVAAVKSGQQASAIASQNQMSSLLLSAFRGALGGATTAGSILTLGNTLDQIKAPAPSPDLNPGIPALRFAGTFG